MTKKFRDKMLKTKKTVSLPEFKVGDRFKDFRGDTVRVTSLEKAVLVYVGLHNENTGIDTVSPLMTLDYVDKEDIF